MGDWVASRVGAVPQREQTLVGDDGDLGARGDLPHSVRQPTIDRLLEKDDAEAG
jgi:hypothetical protein